jgi:4-hydroxy-tetrahydrodipicolinate synthase
MFRGIYTALVTPFRDGAIDAPALERLIETQIAAGITGVIAVGTTGESPTLSHDEKEQVIRLTVEIAMAAAMFLRGPARIRPAMRSLPLALPRRWASTAH